MISLKAKIDKILRRSNGSVNGARTEKWLVDNGYGSFLKELKDSTSFLPENSSLGVRVYCVDNDIKEHPLCPCGNKVKWHSSVNRFVEYCSTRCKYNISASKEKYKNACIEKYGVDNAFKDDDIKNKIKDTNIKKYGVDNPSKSDTVIKKIKESFQKFEGGHPLRDPEIKSKAKCGIHMRDHIDKEAKKILDDTCELQELNKTHTQKEIAHMLDVSTNVVFNAFRRHDIRARRHSSSLFQKEVLLFLQQFNLDILENNRQFGIEIDIFDTKRKVGIECNGSYWHSELNGRGKNYHLNKTLVCLDNDVRLLHLWEHNWNSNRKLWQGRLKSVFGLNDRIYARKCILSEIGAKEANVFLKENHSQKVCPSSVKIGLFYDGELISCMTFSKTRYSKNYEWELTRFCSKIGYTVVGAASKLFKYFVNRYSPSSIVSYSDRSWNTGQVYQRMGFSYSHSSAPNYFYTNDYITFKSRIQFQKHKLENILEKFDPSMTEWENMKMNGYDRIWDCGNDVWVVHL